MTANAQPYDRELFRKPTPEEERIAKMTDVELDAHLAELNAKVDEAVAWAGQCKSALMSALSEHKGTRSIHGHSLNPVHFETVGEVGTQWQHAQASSKVRSVRRALSEAEASEKEARQVRQIARLAVSDRKRRRVFEMSRERNERKRAERETRQAQLDAEAVRSIKPSSRDRSLRTIFGTTVRILGEK